MISRYTLSIFQDTIDWIRKLKNHLIVHKSESHMKDNIKRLFWFIVFNHVNKKEIYGAYFLLVELIPLGNPLKIISISCLVNFKLEAKMFYFIVLLSNLCILNYGRKSTLEQLWIVVIKLFWKLNFLQQLNNNLWYLTSSKVRITWVNWSI